MPGWKRHCRSALLAVLAWQRHCRNAWLEAVLPQYMVGINAIAYITIFSVAILAQAYITISFRCSSCRVVFVCRNAQRNGMPRTRTKWRHLIQGAPTYDSAFRHSLPSTASLAIKREIATAAVVSEDVRTHDTSHLLTSEEFLTKKGRIIKIEFYDPVKLVQYILDHSAGLA